jgi:uncharacterized repeat protein (TIGR01451 family)
MNTKNLVFSLITGLAITVFAASASPVFADTCTTQYGGNQTCQPSDLLINKQVQNPVTGAIVDNLGADRPFSPGATINFQLTIQNTSGQTFDPVTVNDVFPPYLTFISGPGTYNASNRTLTFLEHNLIAGETRTEKIAAKVVDASQIPSSMSPFCENNYAEARDDVVGRFDSDTAQICIQTTVSGTTTLPVAGFNDLYLLLPFAGMGLTSIALLKKKG